MKLKLDVSEVLRYMGHGGEDAHITQTAQQAIARMEQLAAPRWRWVECAPDALPLSGKDIRRHLAGCDRMAVLCATLGAAVDREIRLTEHRSMLLALALDAAAGEAIEKVCDAAEAEIREAITQSGRFLTGRYSPGYGDLPLELQRDIFRALGPEKRIGVTLNGSLLMTPSKSVTAIAGIEGPAGE